MKNLRIALITGRHPYDVVNFQQMFRSLKNIDAYPQSLEEFAWQNDQGMLEQYDAFVFYNFHQDPLAADDAAWWQGKQEAAIKELANSDKGLVILHHGLLCWPDLDLWQELVGMRNRNFSVKFNQTLNIKVENNTHPITQNLQNWKMIDETYLMAVPEPDSDLLLSTDHPDSMKYLAWTRQRGDKRIFNFQSGHDNQTWTHPNFRTVLERGIHWVSRNI